MLEQIKNILWISLPLQGCRLPVSLTSSLCQDRVSHPSFPSMGATLLCDQAEGKQHSLYLCLWGKCCFPLSICLIFFSHCPSCSILCCYLVLIKSPHPPTPNPAQALLCRSHLAVKQLIFEIMVCYVMSRIRSINCSQWNAQLIYKITPLLTLFYFFSLHFCTSVIVLPSQECSTKLWSLPP